MAFADRLGKMYRRKNHVRNAQAIKTAKTGPRVREEQNFPISIAAPPSECAIPLPRQFKAPEGRVDNGRLIDDFCVDREPGGKTGAAIGLNPSCIGWSEELKSFENFRKRNLLLVLLFSILAFVVMGYHPGLEDDGVYLTAVKSDLNSGALSPRL